ncbi:MAG: aspartate carbamoyltransferase regulatory subunit [Candidatus Heimdallarchaeaceae archaeon]
MNEKDEEKLIVTKIKEGTVIDRIPPGKALKVLEVLGIDTNYPYTVALAIRVSSKKTGLKDIVKIKGKELNKKEVHKLSFIAPNATVNIIKGYHVIQKEKIQIPDIVEEFIKCLNPNCISNSNEPVSSKFRVISKKPLVLRCVYCDRLLEGENLQAQL